MLLKVSNESNAIEVDNKQALQFKTSGMSSVAQHTLFTVNGHIIDVMKVDTGSGDIPEGLYQQMVASFKFI